MNICLAIIICIALFGARFRFEDVGERQYMSRYRTTCVNGIFVMFVLMRHVKNYITPGPWDRFYYRVDKQLLQLIVTSFLFYSGYGIMYSLLHKKDYVRKIPRRIAKVWIPFAISVLIYVVLAYARGGACITPDDLAFPGRIFFGGKQQLVYDVYPASLSFYADRSISVPE